MCAHCNILTIFQLIVEVQEWCSVLVTKARQIYQRMPGQSRCDYEQLEKTNLHFVIKPLRPTNRKTEHRVIIVFPTGAIVPYEEHFRERLFLPWELKKRWGASTTWINKICGVVSMSSDKAGLICVLVTSPMGLTSQEFPSLFSLFMTVCESPNWAWSAAPTANTGILAVEVRLGQISPLVLISLVSLWKHDGFGSLQTLTRVVGRHSIMKCSAEMLKLWSL